MNKQSAAIDLMSVRAQEVWQSNFDVKLKELLHLIELYDHIAVTVYHLADLHSMKIGLAWNYEGMKKIVDANPLIQLTFSLYDKYGSDGGVFQFKMKLDEDTKQQTDRYLRLKPLMQKQRADGIEPKLLAERFLFYKLFVSDKITWLTLNSMYEVAYMVKTLSSANLPDDKESFVEKIDYYFPKLYDVRYLAGCLKRPHSLMDAFTDEWRRYDDKQLTGLDAVLIGKWFYILKFDYLHHSIDAEWNRKIYILNKLDNPSSPPLVFRKETAA